MSQPVRHDLLETLQTRDVFNGKIVGISACPSSDHIIFTTLGDGVAMVHKDTVKAASSWTFGADNVPVRPAVAHGKSGAVCVPMSSNDNSEHFIYVWNMHGTESKNLSHMAKRINVQTQVQHVLPVSWIKKGAPGGAVSFCAILGNGQIKIFGVDSSVGESDVMVGKDVVAAHGTQEGLIVVYKDVPATSKKGLKKQNYGLYCGFFEFVEGELVERGKSMLLLPEQSNVMGSSCSEKHAAILTSEGLVCIYAVPRQFLDNGIPPIVSRQLKHELVRTKNTRKRASADSLAQGPNCSLTLDSANRLYIISGDHSQGRLIVLDTSFGSVLSCSSLDLGGMDANVQATVVGRGNSDLCIALLGHKVMISSLSSVPPPTLANLVGSLNIPFGSSNERDMSKTVSNFAKQCLDPSEMKVKAETQNLGQMYFSLMPDHSVLGSGALVSPASDIVWEAPSMETLHELESEIADLLNCKKDSTIKKKIPKAVASAVGKARKLNSILSYEIASSSLAILLELKDWTTMEKVLLFSHPRSLDRCAGVALGLLENSKFHLLYLLLRNASAISAKELSLLLHKIVTTSLSEDANLFASSLQDLAEFTIKKAESQSKKMPCSLEDKSIELACLAAAAVEGFGVRQLTCHALLALKINPSTMLAALSKLPTLQLAHLIRYLMQWMQNITHYDVLDGGVVSKGGTELFVPDYNRVIEWASAVLDAGNVRFVHMSAATENILQQAIDEVGSQVSTLKGLKSLKGLLFHIASKAPLPSGTRNSNSYSIEFMSF